VEIRFKDGVRMHFMSDKVAKPFVTAYRPKYTTDGTTFFGSKGWVSVSRAGADASNADWLKLRECEGNRRVLYRNWYYKAFVDSVRERSPSVGPIEDAVRSDALSHLSLLAIKDGGEVVWDPQRYRIESPRKLRKQMSHPIRSPWVQT
jgi:hypothetical protein